MSAIAQAHRTDMDRFSATGSPKDTPTDLELAPPPVDDRPTPAAAAPEMEYGWNVADPGADPPASPSSSDDAPPWPGPVTVTDAPALAPADPAEAPAATIDAGPQPEDIETVAARRARREAARRRRLPLPGLATTLLALVAINTALLAWRAEVVRLVPQTASLYAAIGLPVNLRGLTFADVATRTESNDGVQVLVIEGAIVSTASRAVDVPRLRFAVRNDSGHEIYAWTALPGRSRLAPGETLAFRARLASPPLETNDVLVRFFNRHDLIAGIP